MTEKKSQPAYTTTTPWRVFLPIVLIMGISISVWGGLTLNARLAANWKDQMQIRTEKYMAFFDSSLSRFQGAVEALPTIFQTSNKVGAGELRIAAQDLKRRFDFVDHVGFVQNNKVQYAHPQKDAFAEIDLAQGLFDDNKQRIIGAPATNSKAHPHVFLFQPVQGMNKNTLGALLVNIDVNKLMDTALLRRPLGEGMQVALIIEGDDGKALGRVLRTDTFSIDKEPTSFKAVMPQNWADAKIITEWQYAEAFYAPKLWPGLLFIGVGAIVTLLIGWVFLAQQSMAKKVRQEVVQRTNELEQASRRFRLITDNAYDLISIVNLDGVYEYVNSAYNRVLGYAREEIRGTNIINFVHDEDREKVRNALKSVVEGAPVSEVTFRMSSRKGEWVHLEAVAKGLYGSDWNLNNLVLHGRDITSRKKFADELSRSEQRFRDFADSSADWLWEVNEHFEFTYVSPGIKGTLGYTPEDMVGRRKFDTLFGKDDDNVRELLENLSNRHQPYRDIEFWTRSRIGERVCLRISGVPIFDKRKRFMGYRGAATNITSSKIDQENMLRLATTDSLTGLYNRNQFMQELERTVALARRHDTRGVLLFIDLDRFKAINDTHGHDAGDAILLAVSDVFQKELRSTDIIARLGGDEFGIIMHNVDTATAGAKIERLIEKITSLRIDYKGAKLRVTMSAGMVGYPQGTRDCAHLITSADLAMYQAKEMGRNRLYVDEGGDGHEVASTSVRNQLEWIDRLRVALDNDGFEMHYQPIVPTRKSKSRPVIYEALIRLRDEEGKLGAPAYFIDAAEHFGLIQKLDKAVINRCIRNLAEMQAAGKDAVFSINLSGISFGDREIMDTLKKALKSHKVDPSCLIFEVTETAAMRDLGEAAKFVKELKKAGCKFALDDFGAGFSSFAYIKNLDVDFIKIDGSYIQKLDVSPEDQLFVKALVDLAKGLKIETVAEFVESKEVLQVLKKLGINYMQGYHLSRPQLDLNALQKSFNNKSAADF